MTTNELTWEQQNAIEEMISRRMENTGESREQASDHLVNLLQERIASKIAK